MEKLKIFVASKDTLYMFSDFMTPEVEKSFNELSVCYCAILETEDGPKRGGILIAHPDGEELYIDWLFVNRELRGKGVATALMEKMSDAVLKVPELSGIMAFAGQGEEELRSFFDKAGFLIITMEGRGQFVAKVSECGLKDAMGEGAKKMCFPLDKVSSRAYHELENDVRGDANVNIGVPFPIRASDYSPLSMVFQLNPDRIDAILLLKEEKAMIFGKKEHVINVSWLYSSDKSGKSLIVLLSCVLNRIKEERGDVILTFTSLNEVSMNLGRKLFKDAEFDQMYMAYLSFEE